MSSLGEERMTELEQQISDLRQGDHLCLFYEKEPAEQMPAVIPFIQEDRRQSEFPQQSRRRCNRHVQSASQQRAVDQNGGLKDSSGEANCSTAAWRRP